LDLKTRVTAALGKSNSTPSTGLCLPTDFPMHSSLKTSGNAALTTSVQSMSLPPASRVAGARESNRDTRGLRGARSSLFWEAIRILKETQPRWVVLENVVNLLAVNDSHDFETVVRALADCGHVGFWRVLNAQYFGVPQQRRRVFLVAGYRRMPPFELLADAAPVDAVPPASQSQRWPRPADAWAANTLLADRAPSQIAMGCTTLVAHANGWDQMAERRRASEVDGFCPGSSLLWRS